MHDINQLEKKWYHYKFKKLFFPLVTFSIVAVATVSVYYYATKLEDKSAPKTRVLAATKEGNGSLMMQPTKKSIATVIKKSSEPKELALEPIIPVIDMEKEERGVKSSKKSIKPSSKSHLVKAKPNDYLTPKELAVISRVNQPHVTKKMKFQSTTTNYFETMKKKFSKSKNPREALLLAKAYYKEKNYKNAETWALKANKLNSSLEESWLIFAKAKAKLGKKEEALKILVSYYKKSHSFKAKELIGKIKTGKI